MKKSTYTPIIIVSPVSKDTDRFCNACGSNDFTHETDEKFYAMKIIAPSITHVTFFCNSCAEETERALRLRTF